MRTAAQHNRIMRDAGGLRWAASQRFLETCTGFASWSTSQDPDLARELAAWISGMLGSKMYDREEEDHLSVLYAELDSFLRLRDRDGGDLFPGPAEAMPWSPE